jgi:hypothetical protein
MNNIVRLRLLMLAALLAVMFSASGCVSVGHYFEHRYRDFTRMIDLGITVSKKPQLGLYWNSLDLFTVGYSNVDGYFIGWGGGQLGVTRMYNHCWAFVYGEETIGWGPLLDTDRREEAIVRRRSNVLGILSSVVGVDPTGDHYGNGPDYTPACVHFVPHLGYIGIAWNARYAEIAQFAVGWFGLDITGHDGDRYPVGKWSFPWRKEPEPAPKIEPADEKTANPPAPNAGAAP